MRPRENPPVDDVLSRIVEQVKAGTTLPVTKASEALLKRRYKKPVAARLKLPDSWRREGENVLASARQLGAIANAIAALHKEREIEEYIAQAAAEVVEKHCEIAYGEGRWCEWP